MRWVTAAMRTSAWCPGGGCAVGCGGSIPPAGRAVSEKTAAALRGCRALPARVLPPGAGRRLRLGKSALRLAGPPLGEPRRQPVRRLPALAQRGHGLPPRPLRHLRAEGFPQPLADQGLEPLLEPLPTAPFERAGRGQPAQVLLERLHQLRDSA